MYIVLCFHSLGGRLGTFLTPRRINSIAEWTKERAEEEQARRKLESKLRVRLTHVTTQLETQADTGWRRACKALRISSV